MKASNGFFSKAAYLVKFEKEGYDNKIVPIHFKIDEWYFGNLLLGGIIGGLIVDPATGAMFKLDTEFLNEKLKRSIANSEEGELKIYTLDNIPDEWSNHLVLLENK